MSVTSLPRIEVALSSMRSRYNQAVGKLELLKEERSLKQADLTKAVSDIEVWQQVQVLFTKASDFARQQLKMRVEETVSAALQAVFEDDGMGFEVVMRTVGGAAAAEWSVVSQYGDVTVAGDPEDARGGGVSDVVSLALRLALLELARPRVEGPVVLDEAGKHVSAEFVPNVAAFLQQYARQTGRQVILVTHQTALADVADVSYKVQQGSDGVSEVSRA